jgi:hypothetical protein
MFCPECGTDNPQGAETCANCGSSLQLPARDGRGVSYGASPPTSSLALVSLILGILGWVILPLIGSVLAVVFGHVALGEIDRSGGQVGGRGVAQVGLVLGYSAVALEVLSALIFVVFPVLGCGLCGICGALTSAFGAWA